MNLKPPAAKSCGLFSKSFLGGSARLMAIFHALRLWRTANAEIHAFCDRASIFVELSC
jgi:hypothetical protein